MRLEELFLDGFGHFCQQTVGPMAGAVTVFCGPNEAGKSTLLAFIRTVLFGFPRQGRNMHYPPLSGGRHGGRIRLSDDDGNCYTLERYAGARGVTTAIRTDAGDILDEITFLPRLTGHANPTLFNNVFAFSIDELQEVSSLNQTDVSRAIYSAGQGAPGLPALSQSLKTRRESIFLPRGRSQVVSNLVAELQEIERQLKVIEGNAGRYGDLTSRKIQIELELKVHNEERFRLSACQTEIGNRVAGWEEWVELAGCESQLRELPQYEQFPEDPIARLESIEERSRQAQQDLDQVAEQFKLASESAAAIVPDEDLLKVADRLEEIRRRRGSFDESLRDLPERQEELQALEGTLTSRIHSLGPGWDENNLDSLEVSLTTRTQVEQWKNRLTEAYTCAAGAQLKSEQEQTRLAEFRTEQQDAQHRLSDVSEVQDADDEMLLANGRLEELVGDRQQLELIRRERGSFDASVRDLPERRAELGALVSDLGERLRDLGQGWDEERLEAFDTSIVVRQEVERFKETLAVQTDESRQARQRLEQELDRLTERQTAVREAKERLPDASPALDHAELTRQQDALRTSRGLLDEYERARFNHDNLEGQLTSLTGEHPPKGKAPALLWPALLALAGVLLIAAGGYLGDAALVMGLVGGIGLMAAAVHLFVRGRSAPPAGTSPLAAELARRLSTASTSVESTHSHVLEAAAPLGLDGLPTTALLNNAEVRLESAGNTLFAWDQANDQLAEAERLQTSQEQRLEEVSQRMQATAAAAAEARQQWQEWLVQQNLPDSFNPDTVVEFMGRLETARAKLEQVRQMRHRVQAIEVDTTEYLALVQPISEKYGVTLDASDQQRIMEVADTLIQQYDVATGLVGRRDDAERRLKREEQAAAAAIEEQTVSDDTLAQIQASWRGWLHDHGLQDDFTPDTVLEFLARVETARASLAESLRMRSRVAAIETDIEQFRDRVEALPVSQGVDIRTADPRQLATVADTLINRLDEAKNALVQRKIAIDHEEDTRRSLERQGERLQSVQKELAVLLTAGGTDDPEDFRLRARHNQERLELQRQRGELIRALERRSGPGDKFDAFRESLAGTDLAQLTMEDAQLSERLQELESLCIGLLEERGGIDTELAQLMGEEESSRLRIRHHTKLEQLQEYAREWSKIALAETLLEKTRRKFELERQPSVVRHAQEFLSNITGQRYNRLSAPVGEQTITVIDDSGAGRSPEQLSRGTREQLYLTLRFGLIREFGEHAERLPVVVDEVLVNFDPQRAQAAAESFAILSDTNQVLVFTCHPATADMFVHSAGAQVINLPPVRP